MFEIGLSTNAKIISEELFKAYDAAGIRNMEVSTSFDKYAALDYKELAALSEKYGVKLWSFHLPFMPFEEIDISDKNLKEYTLAYLSELIKKATDIGIDKFIVHPSGEPIEEENRKARIECAKESLAYLASFAGERGATIAVENLPRTCLGRNSSELLELISADNRLRVCFDTNHLLGEDICEFIQAVGDKIITTHVSDYDFLNERHWLPGEGRVDWHSVAKKLSYVGYKGIWLYEVAFKAPDSIERDRDLSCDDFVRNSDEIFAGRKITVIGNPKPGLTSWKKLEKMI